MLKRKARIEIRALRLSVHLGVGEAERSVPQDVEFDVRLDFEKEPPGTRTDEITDTLCYAGLCDTVEAVALGRPYRLVESLGHEVYQALRERAGPGCAVEVTVHKLHPPILALRGGVRFTYGDEIP